MQRKNQFDRKRTKPIFLLDRPVRGMSLASPQSVPAVQVKNRTEGPIILVYILTPKYHRAWARSASLLDTLDRKDYGVEQNCDVHKEPAISNIVEIVLQVLMNEISSVCTQLPKSGDPWHNR